MLDRLRRVVLGGSHRRGDTHAPISGGVVAIGAQDESLDTREQRDLNWHREAVGGRWDEIGKLQFDFLVEQGVKPFHYLLDIGCGSLRGGVRFIAYLEAGHYFGVDKSNELLDAGREIELARYGLAAKNPELVQMESFDFSILGRQFDYALAQSVFTHLPLNSIIRGLANVERALAPGGRFYATFFENPGGKFNLDPIMHLQSDGPDFASYFDCDPYHYDWETVRWICEGTGLQVEYIGEWGHPRDQKMLVFTRKMGMAPWSSIRHQASDLVLLPEP